MISVANAEIFLTDLKGRLVNHHEGAVKLSARAAAVMMDLAGQDDPHVIAAEEDAEFFLSPQELNSLIQKAERQLPLLRRAQFRLIVT